MRHKRKKKWWPFIILIILVIAIIWFSSRQRDFFFWEKPIKDFSNGIMKQIEIPFSIEQNNWLDLSLSEEKEEEINELKELLELKTILSDFDLLYVTTIHRNVSYFQELLTIDKGSKEGIEINDAVVTPYGLIGKVEKVSNYSSEVRLLTSTEDQLQVSVAINSNNQNYYGVLNQYFKKDQVFVVTGIPATAEVSVNSLVTTSGLGGIFPSGILIGTVTACHDDTYGITKTIEVKANQDLNDLKYLAVLKVRGEEK